MTRAKTKQQLIQQSQEDFDHLFVLIHSMSQAQQEELFTFEDRDKNIRDVLIHLYEWHQLLLNWCRSNQSGHNVDFLPYPYNWKTYPELNIVFWQKHQKTSFQDSISLLTKSHLDVMSLIDLFSNEELFIKQYFSWTGTTSLGAYCVSSTSSHYNWAIKKIKKHNKSMNNK